MWTWTRHSIKRPFQRPLFDDYFDSLFFRSCVVFFSLSYLVCLLLCCCWYWCYTHTDTFDNVGRNKTHTLAQRTVGINTTWFHSYQPRWVELNDSQGSATSRMRMRIHSTLKFLYTSSGNVLVSSHTHPQIADAAQPRWKKWRTEGKWYTAESCSMAVIKWSWSRTERPTRTRLQLHWVKILFEETGWEDRLY